MELPSFGFDEIGFTGGLRQGFFEFSSDLFESYIDFGEFAAPLDVELTAEIADGEAVDGSMNLADGPSENLGEDEAQDDGGNNAQHHYRQHE